MKINELIEILKHDDNYINHRRTLEQVSGKLCTDSRKVALGDIFVCINGENHDGHAMINDVVAAGAELLICEIIPLMHVSYILVKNSRRAAALTAKLLYNNPSAAFTLIGITGTNGKTSTAKLVEQICLIQNINVGCIGSLGIDYNGHALAVKSSTPTTPDIVELNETLNKFKELKTQVVVMEVSSHAWELVRVYGLEFDVAAFLNLSRDHLDFHGNMENYFQAKFGFIKNVAAAHKRVIINIDDEYGKKAARLLPNAQTIGKAGSWQIRNLARNIDGISLQVVNKEAAITLHSHLLGSFNIENLAMAGAICSGIITGRTLTDIKGVRGRMERVKGISKNVIIDYAHSPASLAQAISSVKGAVKGKIIVIVGAGGNRDQGKRPQMAKVCADNGDYVIITSDNPRYEAPAKIIKDMLAGVRDKQNWWAITERREAVKVAINLAGNDDLVLICGKGHETYQEIKGVKYPFDDQQIAITACENLQIGEGVAGSGTSSLALPLDNLMLKTIIKGDFSRLANDDIFYGVSTDSRTINEKCLFFAIKGENFDGHRYVEALVKEKSAAAIISERDFFADNTVLVDDVILAYLAIAKRYLAFWQVTKIAITGSYGKTSTKEYLAHLLADQNIINTYKNENNFLGLPRTIFRLRPWHTSIIMELGISLPGEMQVLSDTAQADIAIISSVAAAHLLHLKSPEGVYQEKSILFRNNHTRLRFYPGDNELFEEWRGRGISFGSKQTNDYVISTKAAGDKQAVHINEEEYLVDTSVSYMAENAGLASIVAQHCHVAKATLRKKLNIKLVLDKRMEIREVGQQTWIIDCYNANPESMQAAIQHWQSYQSERPHYAIIGDMLELGDAAGFYHQQIGHLTKNMNIIAVGPLAQNYHAKWHYADVEELIKAKQKFSDEAVILVKASNGVHLDKYTKGI